MSQKATSLRSAAETLSGRLPPLIVSAEHLANSLLPGAHGRRRAGQGAEFWQFRPYGAEDAAHRIDWRRSARGDDLYVRENEWQAARAVTLWVDPGAAMQFSGDKSRDTKSARARLLALALGLVLLRGGERVGLAQDGLAPRSGRVQAEALSLALASEAAEAEEHLAPQLDAAPAGGHVILFSDFLGDLAPIEAALAQASQRGMRGILVQVLDPVEEHFPFEGRTRFESMSGHLSFETLRARDLRGDYARRLAERKDQLQALARSSGWFTTTLHTDKAPDAGLLWLYHALGFAHGHGGQ